MQTLIVHCHPEPQSFNGTLTETATQTLRRLGHDIEVSDLYAENFNPAEGAAHYETRTDPDVFSPLAEQRHASATATLAPEVRREIDRLERADLVILQFPLWWHAQPAMLKGWFDRVFVSGGLYTSRMRYDQGYFRGKRALCSVTTGAPAAAFGPGSRGGDMNQILWPIHYSLHYMGFSVLPPFLAHGVAGHGYSYQDDTAFVQQLEDHEARWTDHLTDLDCLSPLSFPGWDDWNEEGGHKADTALSLSA